jgi:hypothetical protein
MLIQKKIIHIYNKQKGLASLFYNGVYITSTKVNILICILAIVIHSDMSSCCIILDIIYTLLNLYWIITKVVTSLIQLQLSNLQPNAYLMSYLMEYHVLLLMYIFLSTIGTVLWLYITISQVICFMPI